MSHAATEKHENPPATFLVDPVAPAEKPIWTEPLGVHVAKRFQRKLLILPEADKSVINAVIDQVLSRDVSEELSAHIIHKAVVRSHPLIDAVGTAFSQHRPLTLSPDCIWLVIEQGFAHHLAENAESLRHRLVRHVGRRELSAFIPDLNLSSFQSAISIFSSQIRQASDPVMHETLLCDFSTTTPAVRTASEVALMDCYSSYFAYLMICVCGIPKVTVLGSPDDWRKIRARIEVLETFGLERWVARLRPILDEFVLTVEGRPCTEFWQAIYKPKEAYGTDCVTGWIADLFPYLNDPPDRRPNHILEHERREWVIPVEEGVKTHFGFGEPGAQNGVAPKSFPSGLASVPVNLTLADGSSSEIDLVAGFLAVEQDPRDLALSPVISWSATERPPEKPVMI